jgi:hypothetical protein
LTTFLYRVLFHYFYRFLADYYKRIEKEPGFLRPVIKEVVERYFDCVNPRYGFARQVQDDLVRKELLSPEWAERILSWQHTGFNVHSLVRARTMVEAERFGKYMIRPLLCCREAPAASGCLPGISRGRRVLD